MKTVLTVEDDDINIRVLSKILAKHGGLATKHSAHVDEITRIAENGEVDAILVRRRMLTSDSLGETIDSFRMTQRLKANPNVTDLPIILSFTANLFKGDREHFVQLSGTPLYIPYIHHLAPETSRAHELFAAYIKAVVDGCRLGWHDFRAQNPNL